MNTTIQPPVQRRRWSTGLIKILKVTPVQPRPVNGRRSPAPPVKTQAKTTAAPVQRAPGKPEPSAKVVGVDPIGAIALRSAFGLRVDRESCEKTAKEATSGSPPGRCP
jgi:hypothetical protein